MSTEDQMSPDASPGEVSKKGSGVRRVNNMPMYLMAAALGVFLLIMGLVAMDRSAKQNQPKAEAPAKGGNTSMYAKEIAGSQKDGIVPALSMTPQPAASAASEPAIVVARPSDKDAPPTPPQRLDDGQQNRPRSDLENRIQMAKLQQLEEAVKAKTNVQVATARSSGSTPGGLTGSAPATREDTLARIAAVRQQIESQGRSDPTAAYQARLQQIQASGLGGVNAGGGVGSGGAGGLMQTAAAGKNDVGQFDRIGKADRWQLDTRAEAPISPYELRAGAVIPATLISGVNSELPGQIMAQISQDVFDTATGKWKLFPQGSRLVGRYSSEVAYGQSRILIAWQRVVFPDGKAMDIGSMPGADSAGYAGFNDQVNNHYVRLFASALLMSGVTAGITHSQKDAQSSTNGQQSASSALSEALGQQLGQVTAQLIAKNMNIAPTLEIRPGYRFNVIVTKDLTFSKPYRAFDY